MIFDQRLHDLYKSISSTREHADHVSAAITGAFDICEIGLPPDQTVVLSDCRRSK